MNGSLNYHADAVRLLPVAPHVSESALNALERRERELAIVFPASVREWYSLDGAVSLLKRYSNNDRPVAIGELGAPFDDWYLCEPRDFLAEGLLVFMGENQGVCNWGIKLDGNPDPPVVVEVDSAPDALWRPCADRFSKFIWCQVWDHRSDAPWSVAAQEIKLSATDLDFLRTNFEELPTTHGWPGNDNYRFQDQHGHILIGDTKLQQADWWISARTPSDLALLLRSIWHCGTLSQTLYDVDAASAEVLAELRGEPIG